MKSPRIVNVDGQRGDLEISSQTHEYVGRPKALAPVFGRQYPPIPGPGKIMFACVGLTLIALIT